MWRAKGENMWVLKESTSWGASKIYSSLKNNLIHVFTEPGHNINLSLAENVHSPQDLVSRASKLCECWRKVFLEELRNFYHSLQITLMHVFTEPGHNVNLSLAENFHSPQDLMPRASKLCECWRKVFLEELRNFYHSSQITLMHVFTEPGHNINLSLAENVHSPQDLVSRASRLCECWRKVFLEEPRNF